MCVEPGKMCMHDMMSLDAAGGAGIAGIQNIRQVTYDKFAARGTVDAARWSMRYVAAYCSAPVMSNDRPDAEAGRTREAEGRGAAACPTRPERTASRAPAAADRPMS
jgi:cytochrome o ubiquinol oxidase subunit 2